MFEKILIRNNVPGRSIIEPGTLAEAMLFYGKVNIVAEFGSLINLVKTYGLDTLYTLVNEGIIKLIFSPYSIGTLTDSEFTEKENFDFGSFAFSSASGDVDIENAFFTALYRGSGKRGKSKRAFNRLFSKTDVFDLTKDKQTDESILDIARNDLDNQNLIKCAIGSAIKYYAPNFPLQPDWDFKVKRHNRGFNIFTNLDLGALNNARSQTYFPDPRSNLSRAYLIGSILEANLDLFLAIKYNSELVTEPVKSAIVQLKCDKVIKESGKTISNLSRFQEVVLDSAKQIREVINSGEKTIDDLIPLLTKSNKFKEWLHSIDQNTNLIKEYYKRITENTWLDKLPGKVARFSIFTGVGLAVDFFTTEGIGTLIGLSLGVGDAFILDNLMKGWRPNQFIEEINEFLDKS